MNFLVASRCHSKSLNILKCLVFLSFKPSCCHCAILYFNATWECVQIHIVSCRCKYKGVPLSSAVSSSPTPFPLYSSSPLCSCSQQLGQVGTVSLRVVTNPGLANMPGVCNQPRGLRFCVCVCGVLLSWNVKQQCLVDQAQTAWERDCRTWGLLRAGGIIMFLWFW